MRTLRKMEGTARDFELHVEPVSNRLEQVSEVEIWDWAVRISTVGLFIIALGAVIYTLGHVVVPVVLAWVVATILLPVAAYLTRFGLPRSVSSLAVVILFLLVLGLIVSVLTVPVAYWIGRADELGALLRERMELVRHPIEIITQFGKALTEATSTGASGVYVKSPETGIVGTILSSLSPVVDETVVFLVALVFNLLYQREIQEGVVGFIRNPTYRSIGRNILKDIETNMSRYFGTVAVINVCLGAATTGIAALVGFPQPYLWGVLAATLNFIPYIGPLIVMATFFLVGVIVSSSLGSALIAPLAFLLLTTIEGQVITPALVGHRLTINPFLVFLSIAFWTWMWGPIGAFVSTPLLLTWMVVVRHLKSESNLVEPTTARSAEDNIT